MLENHYFHSPNRPRVVPKVVNFMISFVLFLDSTFICFVVILLQYIIHLLSIHDSFLQFWMSIVKYNMIDNNILVAWWDIIFPLRTTRYLIENFKILLWIKYPCIRIWLISSSEISFLRILWIYSDICYGFMGSMSY